jgi:cbb3-type cytochrome oxidase cytochrome c subunit
VVTPPTKSACKKAKAGIKSSTNEKEKSTADKSLKNSKKRGATSNMDNIVA